MTSLEFSEYIEPRIETLLFSAGLEEKEKFRGLNQIIFSYFLNKKKEEVDGMAFGFDAFKTVGLLCCSDATLSQKIVTYIRLMIEEIEIYNSKCI